MFVYVTIEQGVAKVTGAHSDRPPTGNGGLLFGRVDEEAAIRRTGHFG